MVYVHGVGSHELDPVTQVDVSRILESIRRTLMSIPNPAPASIESIPLTTVIKGDIKLTAIPLGEKVLTIVSRINKSTDDIPLRVYDELRQLIGPSLDKYILVDAQNGFGSDNSWDDNDVKSLAEAIMELERAPRVKSPLLLGIGHLDASEVSEDQAEIGSAGIYIIIVGGFGGRKLLLIDIDGNNITPELNKRLVEGGLRDGFDDVVIITTDNHQFTGSFGKLGYKVVGGESIDPDKMVINIKRKIEDIKLSQVAPPVHAEAEAEVNVIGEDGFKGMVEAAAKTVNEVPPQFVFLYLGLPLILALAISLLI